MVLLSLTKPVSEAFECEILETPPNEKKEELNLIRPCERYQELLKSCKSIRGRLHQYYVYGELLDCNVHEENFNSCLEYRKTRDVNLVRPIIKWEQNLIETRLGTIIQNKAWELRETPPKSFDAPLPEFLAKRQADSLFRKVENDNKQSSSSQNIV